MILTKVCYMVVGTANMMMETAPQTGMVVSEFYSVTWTQENQSSMDSAGSSLESLQQVG